MIEKFNEFLNEGENTLKLSVEGKKILKTAQNIFNEYTKALISVKKVQSLCDGLSTRSPFTHIKTNLVFENFVFMLLEESTDNLSFWYKTSYAMGQFTLIELDSYLQDDIQQGNLNSENDKQAIKNLFIL